jgi:hypothetical protein
MDWAKVHDLAVEAELWSTLAVNAWLILTGAVYVWFLIRGNSDPNSVQILRAAGIALALLFYSSVGVTIELLWRAQSRGRPITNLDIGEGIIAAVLVAIVIPLTAPQGAAAFGRFLARLNEKLDGGDKKLEENIKKAKEDQGQQPNL